MLTKLLSRYSHHINNKSLSHLYTCNRNRSLRTSSVGMQSYKSKSEKDVYESFDVDSICDDFIKFDGGAIDLSKNEINGIAELCINFPERKNAFSGQMMVDFLNHVKHLEQWQNGRAVIVYGKNSFFCAGADLRMVKQIANNRDGLKMAILMHECLTRLQALPLLSVALIEGQAIGGGAEIATACDFRIMTADAEIRFVHSRMGIIPIWGGVTRLVQLIGQSKALEVIGTARSISADEAVTYGLASASVKSPSPMLKTLEFLKPFLENPVEPLKSAKLAINAANQKPYDISVEYGKLLSSTLWGGHDHIRALAAHFNHRS